MSVDPPRIRIPPLNALRAFEAAARHESFAKAAQELNVTPAAVAQQVKALEASMRHALFTRLSQGLRLTKAGRQALPALTDAFDKLAEAAQILRRAASPNEIHIAALPAVAQLWLSPRLRALRDSFPDLDISVTAMEEPPNFRRELYDIALFYLDPSGMSDGQARKLEEDDLFPICGPSLIAGEDLPLRMDALTRFTLLHDATWRGAWADWLKHAGYSGVDPMSGPSFSLYSIALQAAIDGAGILIGRRSLVAGALRDNLVIAPFAATQPASTHLCVLMPATSARSDKAMTLADRLTTIAI